MPEMQKLVQYGHARAPKVYGSMKSKRMVHMQAGSRAGRTVQRCSAPSEPPPEQSSISIAQRGVVALSVVVVFVLSLSTAHSRWTSNESHGRGMAKSLQDKSGVTFEEKDTNNTTSSVRKLVLEARNEYGTNDPYALALYGFDLVIEPHRVTTIRVVEDSSTLPAKATTPSDEVDFHWILLPTDGNGAPRRDAEALVDSRSGPSMQVELKHAGALYLLHVRHVGESGTVLAQGNAMIACRYVRRELRQLTEEDRSEYLKAMRELYTLSNEEGAEKYGKGFNSIAPLAAMHNSQTQCYNLGMHFLNTHAALDLVLERSLQLVSPKVAMAYWDFTVDAATLGTEWPKSEIFGPGMLGSAVGDPANFYQLRDGWFANASSVLDFDERLVDPSTCPARNPYGYLSAPFDYTDLKGIVRSHSYCNMVGEASLARCTDLIACFEESRSFFDWAYCMENNVHATMNGMLGGGHNCKINLELFLKHHPEYSRSLLTFAALHVTSNAWPGNSLMGEHNSCATDCSPGQGGSCSCTCYTDPFDWSDDEVRGFMHQTMKDMLQVSRGNWFVFVDEDDPRKMGFLQDGKPLTEDQTLFLLRTLMVIACEPGSLGAMSTAACPLDPVFWLLHPFYEKGHHVLDLSPKYDHFELGWVSGECNGSRLYDRLPFTEEALGLGEGTELLTNAELADLLSPRNARLSYMYDRVGEWGVCQGWDPCPQCTEAVAS